MFLSWFVAFFNQIGSSHQLRKPIADQRYGLLKTLLKHLYRIGSEIMCTVFCEIRIKSVGGGAKSVFWRKFKMAENQSRGKWVWIYGEMHHDSRNPGKNIFWFYNVWFKSYRTKRKVVCYSATMRPRFVIIFQLKFVFIMHLPFKCWKRSPYSIWEKNTWSLLFLTWESMGNYTTNFNPQIYLDPLNIFFPIFNIWCRRVLGPIKTISHYYCNFF